MGWLYGFKPDTLGASSNPAFDMFMHVVSIEVLRQCIICGIPATMHTNGGYHGML